MFSSPAPFARSPSSFFRFEAMRVRMRAAMSGLRSQLFVGLLLVGAAAANAASEQPRNPPKIALDELQPGMKGEVWTVFQGKRPEPFEVEVTGVIRNAVGPGKALILCQLTDPKVQAMGAVAGMSGSPLYIDGRLAGALSYQVQRFETVRYAGFTPADDLAEVAEKVGLSPLTPPPVTPSHPAMAPRSTAAEPFQALTPVFSLTGLSPAVSDLLGPQFRALGLATSTVGGSSVRADGTSGGKSSSGEAPSLNPGEAVAVALAVGDITIAGTGTVSTVDGNRITAFGHPMLGIGDVALALCAADIVAILPSNLNSMKVSNTGRVIGTLLQDRLSAVAGELGAGPSMIPVQVSTPRRTLNYSIVRHPQLAPLVIAAGVTQTVVGSNDAGFNEGFRVSTRLNFPGNERLDSSMLYAGPQGFAAGLEEFLQKLNAALQNPFERVYPENVTVTIEPLKSRPWAYLDQFQPSTTRAQTGESVGFAFTGRDHQGAALTEQVRMTVPKEWAGRTLELVVMNGRELDRLTGQASTLVSTDLRSFSAYLAALRATRQPDGLYVAIVERTHALLDQNDRMIDAPGSIERIVQANANTRYGRQNLAVSLWENRVFPDRLISTTIRRVFTVTE